MAHSAGLERRGALDGPGVRLGKSGGAGIRIAIAGPRTAVNLRGRPDEQGFVADVQRALAVELPLAANRWHGDDAMAAAWLGPDEWLLVAPEGRASEIEDAVRGARPDDPWLALVDVSHSYTCLVLSGSGARDLLAKGCSCDLRPGSLDEGACIQTVLAKARVLMRVMEGETIEIRVRNSLAAYTAKWLADAAGRDRVAGR